MAESPTNEKITQLQDLLALEKEQDFERFQQQVLQLSLAEKRKKGVTWHPLEIIKQGYTFGERAFITVRRSTALNEPHRFRGGAPVVFYSLAEDKFSKSDTRSKNGVIHFVENNKMKIILNTKDLPDWLANGQLGVDLLFDERTYREMEKVLDTLMQTKTGRLSELKTILLGGQQPRFHDLPTVHQPYLNDGQINAVQHVLAAQDVAIIHGPPGTGKTTTLIHAIKCLCETEKAVLVTAPSNAAVDLLTERLTEKNLNVVRIGNISRVDESIISLTLDGRLSKHPESKNIKKVKIEAAKMRREAKKHKRRFGAKEREERNDAYKEARDLEAWAKALEDRLITEILHGANVIACTLVNAALPMLDQIKFRTVVIDEAAQALQPASWIPITRAHRLVLAGDPFQLPPTVKSSKAKKGGLGITLLEIAVNRFESVNFLNIQYRMNKKIMQFSNLQFYNQQLQAAEMVANWELENPFNSPIEFIDIAGCGFMEEINAKTESKFNAGEYFILREHFLQFTDQLAEKNLALPSIAIISPYRAQCMHIKEEMEKDDKCKDFLPHLSINTIDAFQGQERDMIYISLVRANEKSEIGFLADYRRMNVAMTRAKKQLIVIGDSATIGNDPFYGAFMDYVEKVDGYRSAWEFMG